MLILAANLRAQYDGDWHISRVVCTTCGGRTLSIHACITVRVECPYCGAFNDVLPVDCIRVVRPCDGDVDFRDNWPEGL